jgi:hypothetical protein
MKTTRNKACPCGSGRKYKSCCKPKQTQASTSPGAKSNATTWIFGMLGAFALLTVVLLAGPFKKSNPSVQPGVATAPLSIGQNPPGVSTPQPPGPAPAGKVWSAEHGHWHDAPGSQPLSAAAAQPAFAQPSATPAFTPQPPGPAPAGKVWSTEHGHWHDLPQ